MNAVVIANGDLDRADARLVAEAGMLIAADGGARSALAAGRIPGVVVGDLDSLPLSGEITSAIDAGTLQVERHAAAKDETDTELALAVAVAAGARPIVVLGATGGERLDHELANVLMLAAPALRDVDVRLVRGDTQVRAVHGGGRLVLDARPGDTVSLLPIGGDAVGVTTRGLAFPLDGETLELGRTRGVSNRVVDAPASVELAEGVLLAVERISAATGTDGGMDR